MNELTPYEFDQTDKGWPGFDRDGKYLEAAQAIESYIRHNKEAIQVQDAVSIQTIYFHAGQEYAMSGPDYYDQAIVCMSSAIKEDEGWNVYVEGTIAFLSKDREKLESSASRLHDLALKDERLKQNAEILKRFLLGMMTASYADVYQAI